MSGSGTPRVSVVVPCYNAADTLGDTLDCLIAQTLPDWEAIVVDDGSTDDTLALARAYAERDPRIRVIARENGGVAAARNTGLSAVRTRWVNFLDSDDWYDAGFLQKMLAALEGRPGGRIAYSGYSKVTPAGEKFRFDEPLPPDEPPFHVFRRYCAVFNCTVVVETDLVREVGGFDESLRTAEDWDLWLRIARMGMRWTPVPLVEVSYRMRPNSLTRNARRVMTDTRIVTARARGPDPRVPNPAPEFAQGVADDAAITWERVFVPIYFAASEAALGGDGTALIDRSEPIPDVKAQVAMTADVVASGFFHGSQSMSEKLLADWRAAGARIDALLDIIAAPSSDPDLRRRLRPACDRAVLRLHGAGAARLGQWATEVFEVSRPGPVTIPDGVDGLVLKARLRGENLCMIVLPAWGGMSAADLHRLALNAAPARLFPAYWRAAPLAAKLAFPALMPWRRLARRAWRAAGTPPAAMRALLRPFMVRPGPDAAAWLGRAARADRIAARVEAEEGPPLPPAPPAAARGPAFAVPVLMYHRVASQGPEALAAYRVAPEAFAAQMALLADQGFTAITTEALEAGIVRGGGLPGRPVLITFDDGYVDFAEAAWPVLKARGLTAEVFLVTGKVGAKSDWDAGLGPPAPLMGWDRIAALAADGVRFGSHLVSHRAADSLGSDELLDEALRSRLVIERRLGRPVAAVAPPHGAYDDRANWVFARAGYRMSFTVAPGLATPACDPLALPRLDIRGDMGLEEFAATVGAG